MKEVMKMAWTIARLGQKQFGGKVSEYLSESLKEAHKRIKNQKQKEASEKALDKKAVEVYDEWLNSVKTDEMEMTRWNEKRATFVKSGLKNHVEMKRSGVEVIVTVTAKGGMRDQMKIGELV